MTLRTSLLPVVDNARRLLDNLGLRTNMVTRRLRTWASGEIGRPMPATVNVDYTDEDITLDPSPKVRRVSAQEVASSGGRYEDTDLVVGPITPAYSGPSGSGGYTTDQLDPVITADGVELIYVLGGPNAGEHFLREIKRDRSLRYELVVSRLRRTP